MNGARSTTPTAEQVIQAVTSSVESVLTTHADGHAFADIEDIRAAIVTGTAVAFAGLVVVRSEQ